MIQAQELRIGNWVVINNESKQVRAFSEENVFYSGVKVFESWNRPRIEIPSVCECKIESIKPIPLTEEILLKCGFELKGSILRLNNGMINQFDINKKLIDNCFYYDKSKNGIQSFIELKYIHQLQNLYLALTNQELEIKLINYGN